jgi:succinate-acetate transporter protein
MADITTQENQAERMRLAFPPIASPAILGYYGLAMTTFIAAVGWAAGYGVLARLNYMLSFSILFGGLVQLLAGMWAFRTRDGLGTAIHSIWGSFYMGLGALYFAAARGDIPAQAPQFMSLGFWLVPLALITFSFGVAATRVSIASFSTMFLLALGASIAAVGAFSGIPSLLIGAGWVFIFASLAAWWNATGLLLESVMGYSPIPLYKREPVPAGSSTEEPVIVRGR